MMKLVFLSLVCLVCSSYAMPGGWQDISISDPGVIKATKFAVETVSAGLNTAFVLKLIGVDRVQYQVVAGLNYNISFTSGLTNCLKGEKYDLSLCKWNVNLTNVNAYRCSAKVYMNLSGSYDLLDSKCKDADLLTVLKAPSSKNAGGYSKADPTSSAVLSVADFAVRRISEGIDSMYSLKRINVESAEQQVVAGMNYRFTVTAGFTSCRKSAKTDLSLCKWNPDLRKEAYRCKVVVYVNLQSKPSLTSQSCQTASLDDLLLETKPKNLFGGWETRKTTDSDVQDMAKHSVSFISSTLDTVNRLKLVRVVKAASQVVAGRKYHLVIDFGKTDCLKTEIQSRPLESCKFMNQTHCTECNVEVLSVPWLHKIKISQPKNCRVVEMKSSSQNGGFLDDAALFEEFKLSYGKTYKSVEEEKKRFQIFKENQKRILMLQKTEQGSGRYGNTVFADLTPEEFESMHLGFKPSLGKGIKMTEAKIPKSSAIPQSFDWRKKNAVTEVKNQGSCGSCWAFSTTGNIEGQWALKKKKLISLSEQELVDCDKVDLGCNGGLPSQAYKQIIKLGGLETEKQYPYEGDMEKCAFAKSKSRVYINGSVAISSNETKMAQWLVQNGPISIGINAMAMQFYFGGVSHPWKFLCNPQSLDHGVLIVGYGVETTSILHRKEPFWIIKNSWGASWGEQGYYRVYRGDGTCGLNRMATSAVVHCKY